MISLHEPQPKSPFRIRWIALGRRAEDTPDSVSGLTHMLYIHILYADRHIQPCGPFSLYMGGNSTDKDKMQNVFLSFPPCSYLYPKSVSKAVLLHRRESHPWQSSFCSKSFIKKSDIKCSNFSNFSGFPDSVVCRNSAVVLSKAIKTSLVGNTLSAVFRRHGVFMR